MLILPCLRMCSSQLWSPQSDENRKVQFKQLDDGMGDTFVQLRGSFSSGLMNAN